MHIVQNRKSKFVKSNDFKKNKQIILTYIPV